MCTPPEGWAVLEALMKGGRAGSRFAPDGDVVDAFENDSANEASPPFAANTTCWRWYGPPVAVRVVSALAMLAATTSARTRSACIALPDVSINPKRFMSVPFAAPASLLAVGVNRVHHHLVLLPQQRDAGLELQLRLGQVEAFAVHRNVVAVGARNQSVLEPDMHGLRA